MSYDSWKLMNQEDEDRPFPEDEAERRDLDWLPASFCPICGCVLHEDEDSKWLCKNCGFKECPLCKEE